MSDERRSLCCSVAALWLSKQVGERIDTPG